MSDRSQQSASSVPTGQEAIHSSGGSSPPHYLRALEITLSAIKDFAYVFDRDGRFLYVNKPLLDLWGLRLEQAVGKNFFDLKYPDDLAAKLQRQIQQVIDTKKVLIDETEYTSPDGLPGYYEYIFSPVFDSGGDVEFVAGSTRVITDRRRLEVEREQLLRTLEAERSNLAALIEQAPSFICSFRGPQHVFELANARYFELVGHRELIGKTIREAIPEIEGQGFFELLDAVYRTGEPFIGNELPVFLRFGRDGALQRRVVNFVYQAIRDAGGVSGVFVHGVDVTDMVHSRERLEASLTAGDVATWVWNIGDDRVFADKNLKKFFAVSDEIANGGPVSAYISAIHLDDRRMVKESIQDSVSKGATQYRAEYRVKGIDGVTRWVLARGNIHRDAAGEPMQMLGLVLDVTDRKRAENQLRESEERATRAASEALGAAEANAKFRTFFEQGTCFAGVMTLDGTLIEANRLCLDACGFTREEVVGKKFWDCGWWNRSPDLIEMIRAGSMEAAAGRVFRRETKYFIADGSERIVDLTIAPVLDETGRVIFVAPTGTDITDKRRLADEREHLLEAERSARAEAERTSRIKDEFLATLSHELRTPLNAILGWTQILTGGSRSEADLAEGLKTIERNARAQTQIIEDLLDMSRIISGKARLDVQRIDLAAVVQAAVETTKHAADAKGVRVHTVLDPTGGPVSGDPNRLQQVFWNLLTNAIKFTPRGGRVQVLLERVNSHLEVNVSDTGEGIAAEFLPHVFDRFRQADASTTRRHGGLGLGLSIVKQLVELHGGSVRVKSNGLGEGSTFVVALPLIVMHAEPEPKTERRHPRAAPSLAAVADTCAEIEGVRVLVVDDEPDARALVKRVLADCDAIVTTAASADEAVNLVRSGKFDVLVSDIGMPGEDGYSLIQRVRALRPQHGWNTPAIALTAYARADDRVKAVMAGFQHHVAKPVEPAELIAMIASLMRHEHGLRGDEV